MNRPDLAAAKQNLFDASKGKVLRPAPVGPHEYGRMRSVLVVEADGRERPLAGAGAHVKQGDQRTAVFSWGTHSTMDLAEAIVTEMGLAKELRPPFVSVLSKTFSDSRLADLDWTLNLETLSRQMAVSLEAMAAAEAESRYNGHCSLVDVMNDAAERTMVIPRTALLVTPSRTPTGAIGVA